MEEYDIKNHKIMTMDEEKREKVIKVALIEFAKGYSTANMDNLAKEAGISKGLIFHYFVSKKGLYLFLLKYCVEIIDFEYSKVIIEDGDFLENIRVVSELAMEMTYRYPEIYDFIGKAVFSINQVFPEGLPKDLPSSNDKLLIQIMTISDKSLYRDDIDSDKVENIVLWTMKGFSDSIIKYGSDIKNYQENYESIMNEFEEYIGVLRRLLYKQ